MNVEIYTKNWCPYCHRAKALLDGLNVSYTEYDVTTDAATEQEMRERAGRTSVPQVFINNDHIGGFDDLHARHRAGDLDELLAAARPAEVQS